MSLNCSWAKCTEETKKALNAEGSTLAYRVGCLLMLTGMGQVGGKDFAELALRVRIAEKLIGALVYGEPLTIAELRSFEGFTANVSTETRASFLKRLVAGEETDIRYAIKRDAEGA
jgi:hypothetical protein